MTNTETTNPLHPGKLEIIEQVAHSIEGSWRFVDLGGLWGVHGAYSFHALSQPGCVGGVLVDTHPTKTFLQALAKEPRLDFVQGNFGDSRVFGKLPSFDVVFLFDILLHQVRPDWQEILKMYAANSSHIVIFNQQYTGDRTVRLLDLGEEEYFNNVPHDRKHPTYADLFRKLDLKHPAHERNWRDVHHIWQWGIIDRDLIATMVELGFEPIFSRNWGQVLDLARFENHAFIFSRVHPQTIASGSTAATPTTPSDCHGMGLLDQMPALAAIDDGGTLAEKSAGEQLRLLRSFRRTLRPGASLRIEVSDADARAALIDRARYTGFADATARADGLTLRAPDRSMTANEVPLVTIAIPAFKSAHFAACLDSALAQTYPRLQILVCDDSCNDTLRQIADARPTRGRSIEWVSNPTNLGGSANFIQCLERARGDFVKFLCDDDLLEPDCVERMVAAFRLDPDATLVFSRRRRIDGTGAPLPDDHHTEALAAHDCVFRGEALAGAVIALQSNFIGEPTTVMFRRADLAWIRPHYATFDGHDDIRVVIDIAAWHNLLSQGEAIYIADPLSSFRIHAEQHQARPEIRDLIAVSWAKLERGSQALGFVQTPHPPVPNRVPGTADWRIDLKLPLNRRLAARATGSDNNKAPIAALAETVIRIADAALISEPTPPVLPALPADARQRYEHALGLMATGRMEEGAEVLITLATEGTPVWEVYVDLAEFALHRNDQEAALELMLTAARLAPHASRAVLGAAVLQAGRGEFEPALATLSPYLRQQQNDPDALPLVRHILGLAPELSLIAWARLLADLRYEAAAMRATLTRQQDALQKLRADAAALLVLPAAPTVATSTAPIASNPISKQNDASELPTIQASTVDQDRKQVELARSLIAQEQLAEAADILTTLVLAETPLFDAYYDLGSLAVRQDNLETAISLFGMALERDPDSTTARHNLALVQSIEQHYEEALATLSPLLRSGRASYEDYGLLRDILGKASALGSIAWARLLTDLRMPSGEQKKALDEHFALRQQLAAQKAENDRLRANTITVPMFSTTHPQSRPLPADQASLGQRTQFSDSSHFMAALGYLGTNRLTGFQWFADETSYLAWDRQLGTVQPEIEHYIAAHEQFPGYCGLCGQATLFTVSSGLQLEGHTHLREGMLCAHCGTHNRARMLGLAIQGSKGLRGDASDILLMEATTPLYDHLSGLMPNLIGTEFQSPTITGGTIMDISGRQVRHENILNLSFPDQSLDIIAHADLLEHVPDVETALRECFRTLRNGGELIFSAPFSQTMKKTRKRAELLASGDIQHFVPAEYHGTHLAYYNFGWDLLDLCRAAGFSCVRIGVCFDPLQGLLSTGRFGGYFMQPIVFSCVR